MCREHAHGDRDRHSELVRQLRRDPAIEQLIDRVRMPIAVQITFAQAKRTSPQYPSEEAFVVDLNVPGVRTIDPDAGERKQSCDCILCGERARSEEHTSELQSHSFISYAV